MLFPLNYIGIFVENQLTINVRVYFWSIYFCSIDLYVCLCINTSLFWSLQKNSKRQVEFFLHFSSLFSKLFCLLCPLHFHIHFRINLSISMKKTAGILIRIALNLQTNLGRTDVLTLRFPIHEHGISLHLHRFSFIYPGNIL